MKTQEPPASTRSSSDSTARGGTTRTTKTETTLTKVGLSVTLGNFEVLSHSFRIAKRTSFKELREAALKYWNIKEESLVKKKRKKSRKPIKDIYNLYDDEEEQLTSGKYACSDCVAKKKMETTRETTKK